MRFSLLADKRLLLLLPLLLQPNFLLLAS